MNVNVSVPCLAILLAFRENPNHGEFVFVDPHLRHQWHDHAALRPIVPKGRVLQLRDDDLIVGNYQFDTSIVRRKIPVRSRIGQLSGRCMHDDKEKSCKHSFFPLTIRRAVPHRVAITLKADIRQLPFYFPADGKAPTRCRIFTPSPMSNHWRAMPRTASSRPVPTPTIDQYAPFATSSFAIAKKSMPAGEK